MDNSTDNEISWGEQTQHQFEQLIEKIPVFLRSIAREKVSQKAQSIARDNNRTVIGEKDMVDAFFIETPFGFHGQHSEYEPIFRH